MSGPRIVQLLVLAFMLSITPPRLPAATVATPPLVVVKAEPAPDLNALFENKTGWVGADAAYSVVLGPDRVLWLFGDTLMGKVKDGRRIECAMVNNTIGIQTGQGPRAVIQFMAGKRDERTAASFFKPADGKGWLWPQAGVAVGKKLFLVLPQMDRADGGGPFGFKQIGQWLATIDNPNDDPTAWHVAQKKIPFVDFTPEHQQTWGSAMFADAGNVYIYGCEQKEKGIGKRQLVVARASADRFDDLSAWRFWTKTGWSDSPADATPLADGLATEFSVGPLPGGKGFVLVYSENGLSDRILARVADTPQGPWSAPVLLYTCPEMKNDHGVFCYSAKAHPWAAAGDELVVTYCQNTWEFARIFQADALYRPKFVRVRLASRQ